MDNIESANTRNAAVFLCWQEFPAAQTPQTWRGPSTWCFGRCFTPGRAGGDTRVTWQPQPQAPWALVSSQLHSARPLGTLSSSTGGRDNAWCHLGSCPGCTAASIPSPRAGSAHRVHLLPPHSPGGRLGHRGWSYNQCKGKLFVSCCSLHLCLPQFFCVCRKMTLIKPQGLAMLHQCT